MPRRKGSEPTPYTERIGLHVTPQVRDQVDAYLRNHGGTITELVDKALAAFFTTQKRSLKP